MSYSNIITYILSVYIFWLCKSLINSDSCFIVDYALESIKYKTLFPKFWANTNDFWIYSLIPLIIPLIKINVPLWLSRQIPVFIQSIFICVIIYDLLVTLMKNKRGFSIVLILILTGISGQFMFEVFGDATYGTIIMFILLELDLYIRYLKSENNKKVFLVLFTIILLFLTTCSLRFPIYIGAPILCCIIYELYKYEFNKKNIYMLLSIFFSILVGYLLHKFLANNLFLVSNYGGSILGDANEYGNSINNLIFNYFWINGATNINTYSLTNFIWNDFITQYSPFIVFIFIKFVFALFIIINPFLLFKKKNELDDSENKLLIFTISFLFIMIFFFVIGRMYTWYRYITPIVFLLVMLIPITIKYYLNDDLKNKLLILISCSLVCISSIVLVTSSVYDIKNNQIRKNPVSDLANFLIENDLHNGYCYTGIEHNVYYTLTNSKVRITRLDNNGLPNYWLNSKDWFTYDYSENEVFFLRKSYENHLNFEEKAINILNFDDYEIIVFDSIKPFIDFFDANTTK